MGQLQDDSVAASAIASVRFLSVGPRRFQDLVTLHNGHVSVVLALVLGELDRLQRYSIPGAATTATHGSIIRGAVLGASALEGISAGLLQELQELRQKYVK